MRVLAAVLLCFNYASGSLWPQGVVHYAINSKDYDMHSQDIIMTTFSRIQNEICVKFFNTPANYSASQQNKILYVSNPNKKKDCSPVSYDFSESVVDMAIGYKCIDQKNIARLVVEMLRASVDQTAVPVNSYDLAKKYQDEEDTVPSSTLLTPADRNYLNNHYHNECGALNQPSGRRLSNVQPTSQLSKQNEEYYRDLLWPLAVLMYAVDPKIPESDPDLIAVKRAMATIELASCVVFQRAEPAGLEPLHFLWLSDQGEDMPAFGFQEGNQTLSVRALATGALLALLRALGVPMASNRYDRDNYVRVLWNHVAPGKEHYLEKGPEAAWLKQMPYDFGSATHAPANFMCRECSDPLASRTVLPLQDHLWQRTLSMGRRAELSEGDARLLAVLYGREWRNRFLKELK